MYRVFAIVPICLNRTGFFIGYTCQKTLRNVFHQNAHKVPYPKEELRIVCVYDNLTIGDAMTYKKRAQKDYQEDDRIKKRTASYKKHNVYNEKYREAHREKLNMARRVETAWRFFIRLVN